MTMKSTTKNVVPYIQGSIPNLQGRHSVVVVVVVVVVVIVKVLLLY